MVDKIKKYRRDSPSGVFAHLGRRDLPQPTASVNLLWISSLTQREILGYSKKKITKIDAFKPLNLKYLLLPE